MTDHERAVIAEWREVGRTDMANNLTRYAADIDLLPPHERADASAFMFGRPSASKPVGILLA